MEHMAEQAEPVGAVAVVNGFMYPAVLQSPVLEKSDHFMDGGSGGGKPERAGIGHAARIQALHDLLVDLLFALMQHDKIIYHFAGAAFVRVAFSVSKKIAQ